MRAGRRANFRAVLLTLAFLSASTVGRAQDEPSPQTEAPLVALYLEMGQPDKDYTVIRERQLRALQFEIERNPPPAGAECATTLGAQVFAGQYQRLAITQLAFGQFEEAIATSRAALECRPRWAPLYGHIASAHLGLGRVDEARAALTQGLALDPDNHGLLEARARLDFIEGRWVTAMAELRNAMADGRRTEFAPYAELLFWLTQRRAGVQEPEVPSPGHESEYRPLPIREALLGEITEEQLADEVRGRGTEKPAREWLTRALYYIGQRYLADGEERIARRHFAAVINLKQLDLVEYGMARAELARVSDQY